MQDLFRDVELDEIAMRQPVRHALMVALLREHATAPVDGQAVNLGVHDVLEGLAGDREVAVFVDDVQWADAASLESLAYAARRLGERSVRFVLTRRDGFDRTALEATLARRALVDVEPEPLTVKETASLLRQELGLTLNPRLLRAVREHTSGNPLFVLEVGRALRERDAPEPGDLLDLPSEMASVLGLRVRDLPSDQRTLLLAVAVDPHLTEADLVELAGVDAVETAVADRVLSLAEGGRVRAWHPMLAAAALEDATPSRRRELHGRLAEVVASPERRLRHRALISTAGDDQLAADLSAAAATAGDRGASETALELAELALARTPSGSAARVGRVLDLASRLASAGEAQRLTDFLGPEIDAIPIGPQRGEALLMLLDGMWGTVDHAEGLVERALAECGDDRAVRSAALDARSVIAAGIRVSGVEAASAWADEAMALSDRDDREWRLLSDAANWCLVHSGRPPQPPEGPPQWKRLIWRGEMTEVERLVRQAIAAAEEGGRYQEALDLTISLSDVLVRSGRIGEARELAAAQEDLDLTARESPDVELLRAEIEVRYGDPDAARSWAGLARDRAEALGHVWIRLEADRALAMAELQSGEPDRAAARLRAVFDHVVSSGVREPGMFPVAPELVEALVLLGAHRGGAVRPRLALRGVRRAGPPVGSGDGCALPGAGRSRRWLDGPCGGGVDHRRRGHGPGGARTDPRRRAGAPRGRLGAASTAAMGARPRPAGTGRRALRVARRRRMGADHAGRARSGRGSASDHRRGAERGGAGDGPTGLGGDAQQGDRPSAAGVDQHGGGPPHQGLREARCPLEGPARRPPGRTRGITLGVSSIEGGPADS